MFYVCVRDVMDVRCCMFVSCVAVLNADFCMTCN